MSEQRLPPFDADNFNSESTPADVLRALLERAELSQRGAAKLLGVDERTMRMWCAGQGVAPDYVYRALDPRLTYSEYLREKIEANERLIETMQSGRLHEIPRDYRPSTPENVQTEIEYLRRRNETYQSVLRLEENFHRMRDAHTKIVQQWLTPGSFGLTLESLHKFDEARQEFQSAMADVDHVADKIWACRPFGAFRGKPAPPAG